MDHQTFEDREVAFLHELVMYKTLEEKQQMRLDDDGNPNHPDEKECRQEAGKVAELLN